MPENNDPHRYDDIINLPHHRSATHPPMSMHDRATQFSPFSALTGHAAAIEETARLTNSRVELDEYEIAALDIQIQRIRAQISTRPTVKITYFQPDEKKAGGAYLEKTGRVKKIDDYENRIIFENGDSIPIAEIIEFREGN